MLGIFYYFVCMAIDVSCMDAQFLCVERGVTDIADLLFFVVISTFSFFIFRDLGGLCLIIPKYLPLYLYMLIVTSVKIPYFLSCSFGMKWDPPSVTVYTGFCLFKGTLSRGWEWMFLASQPDTDIWTITEKR